MGQQQSKGELLYHQVSSGNVERIAALCREGAGLEWTDKGGKTPLMVACMNPKLYDAAKTLIELGANVNNYCRGCEGGTPLHHAAKQGLERTVQLLLSHGANALVVNDDGQTALDVARIKGHTSVVRIIESHLCLFSGWLRELSGRFFLELLAPRLVSRKVWVVVLPCGSRTLRSPFKLELAIYSTLQDARPCIHLALWRANLEEPKTNQPDPAVIISDTSTKTRVKLAPASEEDKQSLKRFSNACKGIPQVYKWNFPFNVGPQILPASTAPPTNADTRPPHADASSFSSTSEPHITQFAPPEAGPSGSFSFSHNSKTGKSKQHRSESNLEAGSSSNQPPEEHIQDHDEPFVFVDTTPEDSSPTPAPSAPTTAYLDGEEGPVNYPSVDFSPLDPSSPIHDGSIEGIHTSKEGGGDSLTCPICLDSPVEGACVPCGHMAGCMLCLNEIKTRKWGCPVCRAGIEQVIRIYTV